MTSIALRSAARLPRRARGNALIALCLMLSAAGCQGSVAPDSAAGSGAAPSDAAAGDTVWETVYVHGDRVGYQRLTATTIEEHKRPLLEIVAESQMAINRFGDRNELAVSTTSIETPAGELVRFSAATSAGGASAKIAGRREGAEMVLETTVADKQETARIPWSSEIHGFHGLEQSLERDPPKPGETRRLRVLVPALTQALVSDVELTARDWETTALEKGQAELLRVDASQKFSGGPPIDLRLWVDRQGRVVKTAFADMDQVVYRSTRELALAQAEPARFDLGLDVIVKVDRPLPAPYRTRRARYLVHTAGKDPVALFPASPTQQVRRVDGESAEIVVLAPTLVPAARWREQAPPTDNDQGVSSVLQSDDPLIRQMADEARGDKTDPEQICYALEQYVHETISSKNFSQAFATALDVARSKQGDCTEHAVLLAALARACGLPSRVAVGLVYVESQQGFGYHMWTEIYAQGRWLPVDATLGHGGIGASHLKLGDSNLRGDTAFTTLLSVVPVLGRLKIKVQELE